MKPITEEDLRINEQARDVAARVLGEPVLAAARLEQITQDMMIEASGSGKMVRGMAKFAGGEMKVMSKLTGMGSVSKMAEELQGAGLPNTFILAVTANHVSALEDKQRAGQLVSEKVLKSWGKDEIRGTAGIAIGVPGDDRTQLTLYLPADESKNKYMQASAAQMAKYGVTTRPVRFLLAKDAASQALIDELAKNAPAPGANVFIGGQSMADLMAAAGAGVAQPAPASDPADRLTKLADLHDRGVLTDEEFAAQKAKILGES